MPERIIARLNQATARVEELTDEVRVLQRERHDDITATAALTKALTDVRRSRRRDRIVIGFLAALVALVGWFYWRLGNVVEDHNDDRTRNRAALIEQDATICRGVNSGFEVARRDNVQGYRDMYRELVPEPTAETDAALGRLIAGQSTPGTVDNDCDFDTQLTEADYLDGLHPDGLPIQLPPERLTSPPIIAD